MSKDLLSSPAWHAIIRSVLFSLTSMVCSAASFSDAGESAAPPDEVDRTPIPKENRQALFGELHIHTSLSFDAWIGGTAISPVQSYAFGRGEEINVPASQLQRQQGVETDSNISIRRAWPLDFMAVTDHAENLGILRQLGNPDSAFSKSAFGRQVAKSPGTFIRQLFAATIGAMPPLPPEAYDPMVMESAWTETIKAANDAYEPGQFTTFIGYEWTSMGGTASTNLHRNVIFNASAAPLPFSMSDSNRPEDLWTYMEKARTNGIDVLAIPHNGNASGGEMYGWTDSENRPINEAYALRRIRNEPLTEIAQVKGQSETLPVLSPNDEFADFEVWEKLLGGGSSQPAGSYIRQAYGQGLVIAEKVGANPYEFGVVGGSDIHNGLSTSDEDATAGGHAGIDPVMMVPTEELSRRILRQVSPDSNENATSVTSDLNYSSGAITGVWAEENSRNSIFAALKRKETFATSGTRIKLRVFGGWDFDASLLNRHDRIARCYEDGVAMGSSLSAQPGPIDAAPTFFIDALKDPNGANLDRIQMIKIWQVGGSYLEKIFDVALAGDNRTDAVTGKVVPIQSTVDLGTGRYLNTNGASMLSTVWRDPDFNSAVASIYYVRVLEIPTPRWSTLLALKRGQPLPSDVSPTVQERAWSSPIWFTPKH